MNNAKGFVYVIHAVGTKRVKIGYSGEPEKRLIDLQTSSPFPLVLVGTREGTPDLERQIHRHMAKLHCVGEWFEMTPEIAMEIVTNFNVEEIEISESAATALSHLEMIYQAAISDRQPKRSELDKRRAALVAFIMGATCLADDSDRELAARVSEAVNSHFSMVNAA